MKNAYKGKTNKKSPQIVRWDAVTNRWTDGLKKKNVSAILWDLLECRTNLHGISGALGESIGGLTAFGLLVLVPCRLIIAPALDKPPVASVNMGFLG